MSTQSDTPRADSEVFDDRVSVQLARQLEREVNALQDWKNSALAVGSELDAQRIAKLLGARLGESCYKVIQEKVPELVAERDRLFRALYECYQATGEEAGDLDDFRALVNREAVVVDAAQQLRIRADNWRQIAEFRQESIRLNLIDLAAAEDRVAALREQLTRLLGVVCDEDHEIISQVLADTEPKGAAQ